MKLFQTHETVISPLITVTQRRERGIMQSAA